jgi:hypothetical protein
MRLSSDRGQGYVQAGEKKTLKDVFVPEHVYEALEHVGRELVVESGYRSPGQLAAHSEQSPVISMWCDWAWKPW